MDWSGLAQKGHRKGWSGEAANDTDRNGGAGIVLEWLKLRTQEE